MKKAVKVWSCDSVEQYKTLSCRFERVGEYKYIGTALYNKLNFNKNSDFIHKRCQPRIFCLQKLRSLNINAANSVVLNQF